MWVIIINLSNYNKFFNLANYLRFIPSFFQSILGLFNSTDYHSLGNYSGMELQESSYVNL